MTRRKCCDEPCQYRTYPYGFTPAGDHGTVCNNWFTPSPAPDWPGNIAGQTIIIGGQNFTISQQGGSGAPQPYSLYLSTAPTVPWSLNFTTNGNCTQCGATFTPDPAPSGWVANAFAGHQVTIGSTNYPIVANTTTTFTLGDSLPTVGFSIAFTYYQSTGFTVSGGVITFNVVPTGWFANRLVGHTIEILDGNGYVHVTGNITANTSTSMTLDSPLPTVDGGDFSVSGGVFTPSTPPVGWFGGSTYTNGKQAAFRNKTLELKDPSGVVQYTTTINYFSTTSLYLYAPLPPDGTYTGWTWRIIAPFAQWRWRFNPSIYTSGSSTPCQASQPNVLTWWTPSYNQYPPNWLGGEFVGCTVTYDGVQGVVTANTTNTLTVSQTSPAFRTRSWSLVGSGGLRASGYVRVCGAQITDSVSNAWTSSMAGLSLIVRGSPYTIASVQSSYQCTMTSAVDMDFSWYLANYPTGQYWDVISSGFATTGPSQACGYYSTTDTATSSADGAKVLWHTPLSIKQYKLSTSPVVSDFQQTPGLLRFFFGPGGDCYFETPYGVSSGTSRLVCGNQSCQWSHLVNPDVAWLCTSPSVCIWKADDGYHVLATPAQYSHSGGMYRWCTNLYVPLGLELTVPVQDWEASPHRIGIGGDNGAALCALIMNETRGTAIYPPPTYCATCGGCHVPNWPGPSLPELQVTIAGGNLAGTYILQYRYGFCCWLVTFPQYKQCGSATVYGLGATITPNADGAIGLSVAGTRGCEGTECFAVMCYFSTWTASGTFSAPLTNMSLPGPFSCGIASITASLL